jgi:HK97 family phage major capsid protein
MTVEELLKQLEEKLLPLMQANLKETEAKMEQATAEEVEKQLVPLKEQLQEHITQYKEAIEGLKAEKERKSLPQEEIDADFNQKGGFDSLVHFCYDVYRAGSGGRDESDELRKWRDHVGEKAAGTPSQTAGEAEAGGYLIPTQFSADILKRQEERSDILARAMKIPMTSNKLDIPYIKGFDESQGKVAGNVVWYWKGEEKQYSASDMEFGVIGLNLSKATGLAFLSDELMKWNAVAARPLLENAFDLGLNRIITKSAIRGTGSNQPVGIMDAECTISVDKEPGQAADTFEFENTLAMLARFYSQAEDLGDGIWYMNKTVLPQLGAMTLDVGTGGSAVFSPSAHPKPQMTLWGFPIRFSTQMSALGDVGDVMLVDWSQYIVGQPVGTAAAETAQSIHLQFDYGQTAFRFTFWIDGQPWWPEEFRPAYGATQSPFVKLAARA